MQCRSKKSAGFTLVELLVAMVIASILAAIAIPAYSNYVRKARRTEAKTALLDMASLEERYFSTQNVYSQNATDLGYPTNFPVTVGAGYYQISITNFTAANAATGAPATYSLVATAQNDQTKDTQCQTFTLTSQGVQSATPDPTSSCWR